MVDLAVTRASTPDDRGEVPRAAGWYASILDSMAVSLAVIDGDGIIQYVNARWVEDACQNGSLAGSDWRGLDYLELCDRDAVRKRSVRRAAAGIRDVLSGRRDAFSMEYSGHSRAGQRWFLLSVAPLPWRDERMFVISRQDITDRKLYEERVKRQSLTDGLTGIANRQYFDDFLNREWRRSVRNRQALSLVMVDIDFFKCFNDRYGHQAGDECLRRIGTVLQAFSRRGGDLAARYGGEEFALVFANGNSRHAEKFAERLVADIRGLKIPHAQSDVAPCVTASAGVAKMLPSMYPSEEALIDAADKALYTAKRSGRDRVCVSG